MYTRPHAVSDAELSDALHDGWSLTVTELEYRAVGFGSHHWRAIDDVGRAWFVTVDALDKKVRSVHEKIDVAFERLRAALETARAARDAGATYVVAPIPTEADEVVRRLSDRFAVALYPYFDGVSSSGEYESTAERLKVLDLIVNLHASPRSVSRNAVLDDFTLANRDELVRALDDLATPWNDGPYSERARALLSRHARAVALLLARYDGLADEARARPDRNVLTHGEPHVENVIRTATGRMLIDWDTILVAPPERDLWMLEPGDRSVTVRYTEQTGTRVLPSVLDLYRIRWDLTEVAIYIAGFRKRHTDDADARESWNNLRDILDPAEPPPSRM